MKGETGYGHLKKSQRRVATNLWNIGDYSFRDIAFAISVEIEAVEAYLVSRPGFPGVVANTINGVGHRCRDMDNE